MKEQKIARGKATAVALEVCERLVKENLVQDTFIGGSLKRGQEFVADVDIGIIPAGVYEGGHAWWAETMKDIHFMLHTPKGMPSDFKSVCGKEILRLWFREVQVDIWAAKKYYWGPMCMFIAGSAKLNAIQRKRAKQQGILLSNKGIFLLDGTDLGKFPTELEVYEYLNWKWIPWHKRNLV